MIPNVEMYSHWDDWARALTKHIKAQSSDVRLLEVSKDRLPPAAPNRAVLLYITDATGGAVPAYSDGTNWRRVTDGTIVD